jgi:hypothetical protein
MPVTSLIAVPGNAEEIHASLDRILNSDKFRKTPSLRHFLKYLVDQTLEGHTAQIKESVIAIEVFGRREDFDGRLDNIVRVQAHRLRKLLETYYAQEGRNDKVRFSVPKGSYIPQIESHDSVLDGAEVPLPLPARPVVAEQHPHEPVTQVEAGSRLSGRGIGFTAAIFLSGILLGAIVVSIPQIERLRPYLDGARAVDPAVAEIWSGIFEPGTRTIATYTNPAFLNIGHSHMYLLYRGPLTAPPGSEINLAESDSSVDWQFIPKGQSLYYGDGWTGTGEVLAVNRLTLLSSQLRGALSVVPSRGLGVRDMHGSNVIFLGSPWGNGALAQVGASEAPIYATDKGQIIVRNPGPRDRASYVNVVDANTREVRAVYALFSVLPGMDSGRVTLSSAGLGTSATWTGIDFTTTSTGAAQLVRALKAANGGRLPRYYQAVIGADLIKGIASNPRLVTVRVILPTGPA